MKLKIEMYTYNVVCINSFPMSIKSLQLLNNSHNTGSDGYYTFRVSYDHFIAWDNTELILDIVDFDCYKFLKVLLKLPEGSYILDTDKFPLWPYIALPMTWAHIINSPYFKAGEALKRVIVELNDHLPTLKDKLAYLLQTGNIIYSDGVGFAFYSINTNYNGALLFNRFTNAYSIHT